MERLLTQGSGMFCCFKPNPHPQIQVIIEEKKDPESPQSPAINRITEEEKHVDERYPRNSLLERIRITREKATIMEMNRSSRQEPIRGRVSNHLETDRYLGQSRSQ